MPDSDIARATAAAAAAVTGCLVFSVLHTSDAPSALTRLVELGVQSSVMASSIVLVCAQRLMRRLCTSCKVPAPTPNGWEVLVGPNATFFNPGGCEACANTGYHGRIGIYELLIPTDGVRELMKTPEVSPDDVRQLAIQEGMTTLYEDAVQKAAEGICSAEDVLAIAGK